MHVAEAVLELLRDPSAAEAPWSDIADKITTLIETSKIRADVLADEVADEPSIAAADVGKSWQQRREPTPTRTTRDVIALSQIVSDETGIPVEHVVKDFWVTELLRGLVASGHSSKPAL